MRVLVTGASGFVGLALLQRLKQSVDHDVRGVLRSETPVLSVGTDITVVPGLDVDTAWQEALAGINVVIHTAARVHVMNDTLADPLAEFRRVNVEGTLNLARQAADAGVRRFIFVSSIKVNGEDTPHGKPFTEDDTPAPVDPYGISKREAEERLRQLAAETGLEVVIIRPPLIYGPGVKANFLNLLKIVDKGLPLPLASITNARSLLYLGNLIDAIVLCIDHPQAAGQVFLVSDGEDVSTSELIRRVATALDRRARLLPFPPSLMRLAGKLTGKSMAVDRLLGSLVIDSGKIRRELGWTPPYTMADGLAATAKWYKSR